MSDSENAEVLDAVFATIQERWGEYKDGVKSDSRTVALFKKGVPKIAQKLGEEATEAVIEAVHVQVGRAAAMPETKPLA